MATNYPGSLDDFATTSPAKLSDDDSTGRTHAERHNDVESAVEAIQGELGTDPAGAQATVKARLVSAEVALAGTLWPSTGIYYVGGFLPMGSSGSTLSIAANTQYYFPFWCPTSVSIAALCFWNSGTGAGNARVGIYSSTSGSSGEVPASLVVDAGTASVSSSSFKEVATTQALTGQTWYWLALVSDVTVAYNSVNVPTAGMDNSLSYYAELGYHAQTYGALPSSASTVARMTVASGRSHGAVWVKL